MHICKKYLGFISVLCLSVCLLSNSDYALAGELSEIGSEEILNDSEGKGWSFNSQTGVLTIIDDSYTLLDFDFKDEVVECVIENGVTEIKAGSLRHYENLQNITIPGSVKAIGDDAFAGCIKLKSVVIPNGVTAINEQTFIGCTSLEKVVIPDGIKYIWARAFANCESLTDINIPSSTGCLGEYSFYNCCSLTEFTIPDSVTIIGKQAFNRCRKLKYIKIPASVQRDFLHEYNPPSFMFADCDSLVKIENYSELNIQTPKIGQHEWYNINDRSKPISEIKGGTAVRDDYTGKGEPASYDPTKHFIDVAPGKWYSKADGPIAYVIKNDIMSGTGDGSTFGPEEDCTRSQFVQILFNAAERPIAGANNPFGDVETGKWYYDAVIWAYARGITKGTDATTFGVSKIVTREQLAMFLMNYADCRGFDIKTRADISVYPDSGLVSGWANEAISWANGNGIIKGKSKDGVNYLDPKGNATRAEVAQMIMNFQLKFGK